MDDDVDVDDGGEERVESSPLDLKQEGYPSKVPAVELNNNELFFCNLCRRKHSLPDRVNPISL